MTPSSSTVAGGPPRTAASMNAISAVMRRTFDSVSVSACEISGTIDGNDVTALTSVVAADSKVKWFRNSWRMPLQIGTRASTPSSESIVFEELARATRTAGSSVSIGGDRTTGPRYKIRAPRRLTGSKLCRFIGHVASRARSRYNRRPSWPGSKPSRASHSRSPSLATSATVASGCARKIGDECTTAADCNPNGTRSCDASQPGGYCTIQGCDETSCPDEAACIRYFPAQYLTEAVRSRRRAATPDRCAADEFCLPEGLCAPLSQELRYCAKTCSSGDDCRGGYECRLAGTRGSVAFTSESIRTCISARPSPTDAPLNRGNRPEPAADKRACIGVRCRRGCVLDRPGGCAGARREGRRRRREHQHRRRGRRSACCRASARRRPPRSSPTGSGILSARSTSWSASAESAARWCVTCGSTSPSPGPTTATGVVVAAPASRRRRRAAAAASAAATAPRLVCARPAPAVPKRQARPTHGVCPRRPRRSSASAGRERGSTVRGSVLRGGRGQPRSDPASSGA